MENIVPHGPYKHHSIEQCKDWVLDLLRDLHIANICHVLAFQTWVKVARPNKNMAFH